MRLLSAFLLIAFWASLSHAQAPAEQAEKGKAKHSPNALAKETSPYLLQHADNPVNWYPWGREALDKAKKEKKLIFLSVGYSACHWCHVMEKESFSNEEVAKILNENFICIKVDREERPEVDEVYITAVQIMGERTGWPLSVFLTPDAKPIYGGTYWPREDKTVDNNKLLGFKSILKKIIELNKEKGPMIQERADAIARETDLIYSRNSLKVINGKIDSEILKEAVREYEDNFDPVYGGIGNKNRDFLAPKFPTASVWNFLLSYSRDQKQEDVRKQVHLTLRKMAEGGIYDQLGGGFHRYSTERTWSIPHFEKMLYDNAQLIELYTRGFQDNSDPLYKRVVEQTIEFVFREMKTTEGLFYTAFDADSDGEEGKYFVWTEAEIDKLLSDKTASAIFKARYGNHGKPNFEDKAYVLRITAETSELAKQFKTDEKAVMVSLENSRRAIFEARQKRVKPFLDRKILTAWNGQMIAALALAGKAFEQKAWVDAAAKAAQLLLDKGIRDGRLQRILTKNPEGLWAARIPACLDDEAFLLNGLLALHSATGEAKWLQAAEEIYTETQKLMGDPNGGFYLTAKDDSLLFARVKDYYDNAQPAANNVMTYNLELLYRKQKNEKYKQQLEKSLGQISRLIKDRPTSAPVILRTILEMEKALQK